jgi:hypothetical protein
VLSTLEIPNNKLAYKKIDCVIPGQPVYYTSLQVINHDTADIDICAGWHNTLGAPFLQPGCVISAVARNWATPPSGGEFDETSRIAMGTEFVSLSKAPLAFGGRADISVVPGPIGYTDFVTGAVPDTAPLGWSSLINPEMKMAYITFFTGPQAAAEDDIVLRFNDLWMQYGGRSFTPWAPFDGGGDNSYCLGTENSVSAFCYGLEFSRTVKSILGNPTTERIPAGGQKTLRYGSLFAPYENNVLDEGITAIEVEENALVCTKAETWKFNADPIFTVLKALEMHHF